jgi:DNA-binding response OmpR family regulator
MQRVLVADPDAETANLIAELLKDEGFVPLSYPSRLLSVACIEQAHAKLLILDVGPGDPSAALDLLGDLRRSIPTLPVIILSTDNRMLASMAQSFRALGCIVLAKPFELNEFFESIRRSLDTSRGPVQCLAC